jgi:hypothetical protein
MSLNQVSQQNLNLPSTGLINGTFKSLNVNGVPIGGGGSGDLQSAYDNGNGVINMTDPGKPFSLQGTNGGLELTYGSARGTIESKYNNIRGNLDLYGVEINLTGITKVECSDFTFLTLNPPNFGTPLQALVSNGSGGVEFESLRTYPLTWAGTGVTGTRWLIPKGNSLTPAGTAGTFATRFYCPYNMTANIGAFTRETTGGVTTEVSWYNTTAPATAIYTYDFGTGGAEIVIPNLQLIAGETYTCIATSSGTADVNMDVTFIID